MTLGYDEAVAEGRIEEYRAQFKALLEGRAPTEVLEETPEALREAVDGLSDGALRRPEAAGKWSVLEVVQHLADAEFVIGYRIRRIVAEPGLEIQAFDQDLWAKELRYNERNLEDALDQFGAVRCANLWLARSLTEEERGRHGVHSERGNETVDDTLELYAAHDLYHLGQIARIKKAIAD